ncbi:hypothetical protein E0H62_33665 [Rhizobium leguminosarum bv. viciae]|nr:hypothetical protein E0H62_33665 [Rhizobium leguminosarum bv. viciae]
MPVRRLRIRRAITRVLRRRRNALFALKSKDLLIIHLMLSVGVGFFVCVGVREGVYKIFALHIPVGRVVSFSNSLSDKLPSAFAIAESGLNSNFLPLECLYYILAIFLVVVLLLIPLIVSSSLAFISVLTLSFFAAILFGSKKLLILAPVALFFVSLFVAIPFVIGDMLRDIGEGIKDLLFNPILILVAIGFGIWRYVSVARSRTNGADPLEEGAKEAWEFATGSVADDVVSTLKEAVTETLALPPSSRQLVKLGVVIGVATAVDYFFEPYNDDLAFSKHLALVIVVLLADVFFVLEVVSFIVRARRNRLVKQKKTEGC